ncbi:hypothetical protein A3F37_01905 [Candidatus Saccharibacteria bacterium RIFCSPHIGHO2_12_FULL_41_12]|nr:MAG: hypothetical protein A3F37_01905 [Candidatus Saccharibacteria bacterium RIFCSPHIGHO2_12_FULL_41_12]
MKKYLSLVGVFLVLVLVGTNFQSLSDQIILRNYSPPPAVAKMSQDTTMTDRGKNIFYVNKPKFDDKKSFTQDCTVDEQSIVLGCYVERKGIYLLTVDEPKLAGVMQVTSAHEMLHAAYDRLSRSEKKKIDAEIERVFPSVKNPRVRKNVEAYRAKDASSVPGELHSILGTEVAELSPMLEQYYAKYFSNRQKIVKYSSDYEQAFVSIQDQVSTYDKQLESLKATIDANQNDLKAKGDELASQRKNIERDIAQGKGEELNPQIEAFNSAVSSYNDLLNQTKEQIETYNGIIIKRNDLVTEEKSLIQAIDANINPLGSSQ